MYLNVSEIYMYPNSSELWIGAQHISLVLVRFWAWQKVLQFDEKSML